MCRCHCEYKTFGAQSDPHLILCYYASRTVFFFCTTKKIAAKIFLKTTKVRDIYSLTGERLRQAGHAEVKCAR